MALVLTLQILMLLLATTSFAAAPPGCPSGLSPNLKPGNTTGLQDLDLVAVFVGIGKNNYSCTKPSGFEAVGVSVQLFDATCLNGTDYLDAVVNLTAIDVRENNGNFSAVAIYLQEELTLNVAGQFYSLNATVLEIDVGNAIIRGEEVAILTVIPGSNGDQGKKLTNNDETVVVLLEVIVVDYNAPRAPWNTPCVVGSPNIELEVVLKFWIYEYSSHDY